jgi:hypothetical protein
LGTDTVAAKTDTVGLERQILAPMLLMFIPVFVVLREENGNKGEKKSAKIEEKNKKKKKTYGKP